MHCSSKRSSVNMNTTQTFFEVKKSFLKRNKQRPSLIFLKNFEMNNFLAILELYAFYIKYKNTKFTEISFRGRNDVKYFIQTQV